MQRYWARQAALGAPEVLGQPAWPLFTSAGQRMLSLTEPRPAAATGFAAEHQCAFWNAVLPLTGLASS